MAFRIAVLAGIGLWAWRDIRDGRIPAPGEPHTIVTSGRVLTFPAGDAMAFALTVVLIAAFDFATAWRCTAS